MLGTGTCALWICPTQTMVPTLRQAWSPPRAATFRATICSAESGVAVALGPGAVPAASATADSRLVTTNSSSRSGLGKERITELGVSSFDLLPSKRLVVVAIEIADFLAARGLPR